MTARHPAAAVVVGVVVTCCALTGSAARQGEATCRVSGRITAGPTPLPGVAIVARSGTGPRVTATDVRGGYMLTLPPGEYALSADLTGFQPQQRPVTITAASCMQTIDLQLTLTPRRAAAPAAPAGAGRGRGAAPGTPPASFQTLAVNADAFAATAGDQADAALFLPAGFEAEAGADAIAITGNTTQIDRGLLNQRAEAFARGELPANIADLAAALQGGGGLPPVLAAELAARGGGPGGGGDFFIGGRGGRGGNRIQASADYTFGGSVLDASPYQLRGDAGRSQQPYHRQNFGTQLGGPLRIPGIYRNVNNRTSFQASYSAARGANLFDQYATVPTAAMRAGDFSASPDSLVDPLTGQPFAGNRIPTERISAAATTLLLYIPAPNLPGTTRNFHYTTTTASRNDAVNARVQHTFGGGAGGRGGRGGGRGGGGAGRGGRAGQAGQGGRGAAPPRPTTVALNVQMQYRRSDGDQINVFPTIGGRTQSTSLAVPVGVNITHGRDLHNVNVQMSTTSSSTRNRFAGVTNVAGTAGIAGASADPFSWGVPALSFSSISGLRDVTPSERDDARFGLTHSWTHPIGRHSLRAGGSLQMDRGTTRTEGNANGSFAFTGLYTSAGGSTVAGSDVADFLLGLPQQAALQYGPGEVTLHGRSFNAFVQDDWRARGNVTVNLGVRYELLWPFIEENGQLANLDVTPDFSAAAPVLAGGTGAFSGSFPEALLATDANNIAPRIGVAWRAPRGFVLRGGYGISYNSGAYAGFARQMSTQPPFAATATRIGALNRLLLMESALSVSAADETANTFAVDRNYALGRVETWNADIQRQLGRAWNVSANYTHTRGSSLDVVRAPNRGPDGLRIDDVAPFLWQTSEGESILHSANFTLQRRPVRGISWNAAYTVARSRDNAPSIGGGTVVAQDDQNIDAEWGLSNFDRRHRLTASLNVELPFGPNRPWLNAGGPWASLLENWRLNFNLSLESGAPLSARLRNSSRDVAQGQSGALRADYTGAPIAIDDATIDRFFNTSAFLIPAAGAFGNSARNLIIGPGSRQLNGQISRDVRLGGNRAVTIQVRANNILNLVNYTAVDTFVNSPTFGQISSVRPMRSAQVNLRFRF